MSNTERANIFCYVRPWNAGQFSFLARKIKPDFHVVGCSEHPKVDESGIVRRYRMHLKKSFSRGSFDIDGVSKREVEDIIIRCRLLRSISAEEAKRHVWAMGSAIADAFERYNPKIVISLTVDSYVMDLLRLISENKKVQFIGVIGTFVNGYYRVSARGESNLNPDADLSLVPFLRDSLLQESYVPAFNSKSLSNPRRSVIRRWASNIARVPFFYCKRILSGDYYNYHSWVSQLVSKQHFHLLPPRDPGKEDWLRCVRESEAPGLFVPLQMFPECTVDYWCQDSSVIDYYSVLEDIIKKLSNEFVVVVKEHPSVMGSRPSWFYDALSNDPRVTVVPTYVSSNEVLKEVDGVVVWTGSVGFEALLRGKAVFGLAKPYYASGDRFKVIGRDPDTALVAKHVDYCRRNKITVEEQDAMLSHLAKQLFKGDFINDGSWTGKNINHIRKAEDVVRSLIPYLNSIDS